MKRTPLIVPESLNRMLQSADAAWQRKDFQECIDLLDRARRLAPSNVRILFQLGDVYGSRYDYAAAERCFEQAIQLASRKAAALMAAATQAERFRQPDMAEHYLRRALEQPDAVPEACVRLAELYERHRRLPEAMQFVERALQLNPASPPALLVRARLERLSGRLEEAEDLLRSFVVKSNPETWTHAQAWYELGNILDRREKYDDAMRAFLTAKTWRHHHAHEKAGGIKTIHAGVKAIESNISGEMLRRWFENGPALMPRRRLALLCGYARSGTTLLEQLLDAHPDIVSAEETEVFVDEALTPLKSHLPSNLETLQVLEVTNLRSLEQSREAYFQAMECVVGSPIADRLLIDKNPILTFLIPAFVRVFPETKFLIALRDPRDVILSRFMQPLPPGPLTLNFLTLEGTVEDYIAVISVWRKIAPLMPSPYLQVRYEDIVEDVESVARRTLDFLGVSWNAAVLKFDEHARQKVVRSPTYADVTQPVYKRARGRWRNYQKYLEPHLSKLEPFVKAFGYE